MGVTVTGMGIVSMGHLRTVSWISMVREDTTVYIRKEVLGLMVFDCERLLLNSGER